MKFQLKLMAPESIMYTEKSAVVCCVKNSSSKKK